MPGIPQWIWALGITVVLTATNLFSVANYGEFEFWFALIKVIAIVVFIGVGLLAIFGLLPTSDVSGVSRLYEDGGFMPEGFGAVLTAMLITMFTFMGTEIVTIAAAESPDPAKGIRRAVNSVIWRISLFYLGSIFVVVSLVSWTSPSLVEVGSFQAALNAMGLGDLAWLLDLVVLTAVASCLNSALYTASRMAFSLSRRGEAPKSWGRVRPNGVPTWAILASTAVGFLAVIGNYVLPSKIFEYLLATSGAIALLVYLVIAVSQLRMRRQMDDDSELSLKMWAYPVLTWVVIAFIVFTVAFMAQREGYRLQLWLTLGLAAVIAAVGMVRQRQGALRRTDA
jgi:GABA permease